MVRKISRSAETRIPSLLWPTAHRGSEPPFHVIPHGTRGVIPRKRRSCASGCVVRRSRGVEWNEFPRPALTGRPDGSGRIA